MSLSSLFSYHIGCLLHVIFKVFEVWFTWRVVTSLVWTGRSLMLQGCKRSPILQQKNWVQMLIADAKIRRAYIVLLWQILQCQSQGHCASSDKFCSANPKDIVHTTLTNSALPIPRTLCILFWQILQCQSQEHCTYYSDRSPSANPKDILYTTPASQGHCAYANSPVPITKDFVHTSLTNSPMPIPRTLCLRKLSSANPKDTVCTLLWQTLVPIPGTLCTLIWQCLQCQS